MWEYNHVCNEIEGLIKEDFTSDSVLWQFKKIQTNSERLDFVYDVIKNRTEFNDLISKTKILKCDENSLKYRKEGNEMFRQKKFAEALQLYTRCISNANINTPNLALAYANRSAVFFEKKYYKECLEDITRALENNYPEHLKEKLLNRQKRAETLKSIQICDKSHDPTPSFQTTNRNPYIEAASNCLKINRNNRFGQHIVATNDIKLGEIIAIEKPYASSVEFDSQFLHCHECLEYCVNMIPCTNCVSALYCGKVCRERAFNSYHKYQCDLMQIAAQSILSVQIVLKAFTENKNQENNQSDQYCSNRFKEINALQTNMEIRCLESLYVHSVMASLCYYSLKNHTSFFNDITVPRKTVKDCLLRCEMITNIHQVGIEKTRPRAIKLFNNLGIKDEDGIRIGRGLYSFSCLFSHACAPNVSYSHYGSVQVTRAICNIKQGEQCFSNYGMFYATENLFTRRMTLKENFHFRCHCKACVNYWPPLEYLTEGRGLPRDFLAKLKEQRVSEEGDFDIEFYKQLLPDAINIMNDLERYEPCKNFLRIQHFINEVFDYMGNRIVKF